MAKSHCTYTYIKNSKEYCVLCVKNIARLYKCIHVMTIWDMRKLLWLTHNHNRLMGTITFKVHPITPTSPRIHTCNHFLSIFDLFAFDFSLHIFLLSISCMDILEREKKYPMIFDIPILLCLSTQMSLTLHFCYAEVYRCHIMMGGQQW